MLTLEYWPSDILNQKAKTVESIDASILELAEEMLATMENANGIGLAAPQVGLQMRLFVTGLPRDKSRIFINPEIVLTSIEEVEMEEGCLSLPRLFFSLRRPERVRIQAWNEKGKLFSVNAQGLLARVILHEYDHLQGLVFIDQLNSSARAEQIEVYRKLVRA